MSKWYEVSITVHKVLAVEMPDDATIDEVEEFARGEVRLDSSDITESSVAEVATHQIDLVKRHADQVEAL